MNKFVAFCVSDDIYIPKCVIALLSFAKYNKNFDLVIITRVPSEKNIELCKKYFINVITIDLSKYFYKEWKYPSECYYHFKAPDILFNMGYNYSIFFDGDVYCNNEVNIIWEEIEAIGGVGYTTCKKFLNKIDNFNGIVKKFNIKDVNSFSRRHIQAGIIFYNNKTLHEFGYFEKVVDLFDKSIKLGFPRKGDDSLLAFAIGYYPDLKVKYLISHYNFMYKTDSKAYFTNHQHLIDKCVFYHMTKCKPWIIRSEYPNYVYKYFVEKWIEVMINNFSQLEIKEYFPQFYKENPIKTADIKFYWYKGKTPNFGDYITPYLIEKYCNIKIDKPINPKTTKCTVLLMTGSIMRLCNKNTIIWGSGIRDKEQKILPGVIRSVRGPLTRKRLISIGCECPNIYGDPGLILPLIYNPINIIKKYDLGIIPHYSQFMEVSKLYEIDDNTLIVDLRTTDIESIIDKILACKKIVSSSLHGIVISHAYGIPVRWIKFSNNIRGDDTKFYDHFLSVGIEDEKPINAIEYKKITVKHLLTCIKPVNININLQKLIDASPFDINHGIKKYIRYKII